MKAKHIHSNWPLKCLQTGKTTQTQAVALGLGSLFNHSTYDQNVSWNRDVEGQHIVYRALRDISAGEELCINYGKLWFADADATAEEREVDDSNEMLASIDLYP